MYTLLMVKLVGCGGCERFDRAEREDLLEALAPISQIKVVDILVGGGGVENAKVSDADTGEALSVEIGEAVWRQVRWFPTFILVRTSDVASADASVVVFNARVVNGQMEPAGKALTAEAVEMWVLDQLDAAKTGISALSAGGDRGGAEDVRECGFYCNDALLLRRNRRIADLS